MNIPELEAELKKILKGNALLPLALANPEQIIYINPITAKLAPRDAKRAQALCRQLAKQRKELPNENRQERNHDCVPPDRAQESGEANTGPA